MSLLYIDCSMGAAGDMMLGALTNLLPDQDAFLKELNDMELPGIRISSVEKETDDKHGLRMEVLIYGEEEGDHHHHHHDDHHHHHTVADIYHLVDHLTVSQKVKEDIKGVYRLLAEAEGKAHNAPVEQIHFHEVGTMDALADIAGCCLAMEELKPEKILASPVHVGTGTVRCAHGELPVPAPATKHLLEGIPTYTTEVAGELCTPTGAALLRYFVTEFVACCPLQQEVIGRGFGTKTFPNRTNCLSVYMGTIV